MYMYVLLIHSVDYSNYTVNYSHRLFDDDEALCDDGSDDNNIYILWSCGFPEYLHPVIKEIDY